MKLLFTISFFLSFGTFAQTIKVLDFTTGKGITGVYIHTSTSDHTILTDTSGTADLSGFSEDDNLIFQHIQYTSVIFTKREVPTEGVYLHMKSKQLPTVFFDYPLRYSINIENDIGQMELINAEIVKIENPPTSADMLQNTGMVLVQKSQGGGGSPIIRGFEANKLLLVIDGVRMNNAIYRSGHLQNSITVDNSILENTEIIFGPSSSLYGSDALGGVIHFQTKNPLITGKDTSHFSGSSYVRYNTNNNSITGHFDFSTGKKNWGLLSSITASKFGNIIMGSNRMFHNDSLWGLHPNIVINGPTTDTMIANLNPKLQVGTSYSQYDILEKFMYRINKNINMTLNFQFSTSSAIDRYDRLTEYKNGELRFAEWHYGPQTRVLTQLKFDISRPRDKPYTPSYWFTKATISLAYQKIKEDRVSRAYQSVIRNHEEENLDIASLNLDFSKVFSGSRAVYYGLEAQQNFAISNAYNQDILTEINESAQTRYPSKSSYLSSGIYISYRQTFKNNAILNTGLRYSLSYAQSDFGDTSFISLPFESVRLLTAAPSGNVGISLSPDTLTKLQFMASTGFRAPNIDDYGKVFENKVVTVVPNDQLLPEYAFGGEISVHRRLFKDFIKIQGTVYATYLINAMVQKDFTLNGQDSILYQGSMTKIQAIVNAENAIIYGVSTSLKLNFTKEFNFEYTYNYTKGIDIAGNQPLEHIPPQFGKIAFTYSSKKLNTSIYSFYNFRKRLSDYRPLGDNIDLTPNEAGTPPWWTLNARISYTFWEKLTLQAAIENILDVHYQQFSSGISQPGRNLMFGLRANF